MKQITSYIENLSLKRNKGLVFVFILILTAAIFLRFQNINREPIDAHPMRQNDTACVIYNFTVNKAGFLTPQTCLIRPPTNTQAYFFLELPFYTWLASVFQQLSGSLQWWPVRVLNLVLFSTAFYFLFRFAKIWFNGRSAVWTVLFFSFAPSSIFFFGQAIHPDVLMIAALAAALFYFARYLKSKKLLHLICLILALNISIATRPFSALVLAPMLILMWRKNLKIEALNVFITSFACYGGWWLWQQRFPEASHDWQNWVLSGREQLLQPEMLRHLIWKNFAGEVVGKAISLLAGLGVGWMLWRKTKKRWFVLSWLATIPVYWLIVPAGNIAHQYYAHVVLIPVVLTAAVFTGGILKTVKNRTAAWLLGLLVVIAVVLNGYRTSRYFLLPRITDEQFQTASTIKEIAQADDRVIYLGASSLPLSTARVKGWTIEQPPADLPRSAAAVSSYLKQADLVVLPLFDDSFPQEELAILEPNLDLALENELVKIYTIRE